MKKFLIVMMSIVAALVVACVAVIAVLAAKTTKVEFAFAAPETIRIYNKSYDSKSLNKDDANFSKIIAALNDGMSVTKLEQLGQKSALNIKPRIEENATAWSSSIKERKVCVQLEYASEQTAIIYSGKDSKKIKYKYIMVTLDEKKGLYDHEIYYSESSTIYKSEPIVISFRENEILKYIK